MAPSTVFEENYRQYCTKLGEIDFESIEKTIGMKRDANGGWFIPFFNRNYCVSGRGVLDESGNRANYVVSVILARYILMCPDQFRLDTDWAAFTDFKDAQLINGNFFSSDTEKSIEKRFAGRLDTLERACGAFGGVHLEMDIAYDLSVRFDALPRISLLLLFNDGDEEFPATCKLLFQKQAEFYLDPESLAMTGGYLAKNLCKRALS